VESEGKDGNREAIGLPIPHDSYITEWLQTVMPPPEPRTLPRSDSCTTAPVAGNTVPFFELALVLRGPSAYDDGEVQVIGGGGGGGGVGGRAIPDTWPSDLKNPPAVDDFNQH
jgi:hypothetical protein